MALVAFWVFMDLVAFMAFIVFMAFMAFISFWLFMGPVDMGILDMAGMAGIGHLDHWLNAGMLGQMAANVNISYDQVWLGNVHTECLHVVTMATNGTYYGINL